jgi:hypothetical protein
MKFVRFEHVGTACVPSARNLAESTYNHIAIPRVSRCLRIKRERQDARRSHD